MRGMGRPFAVMADGRVENQLRVKLVNRTDAPRQYTISVRTLTAGVPGAELPVERVGADALILRPGEMGTEPVRLLLDRGQYRGGRLNARVVVTDDRGTEVHEDVLLRGPARAATAGAPATDAQGGPARRTRR